MEIDVMFGTSKVRELLTYVFSFLSEVDGEARNEKLGLGCIEHSKKAWTCWDGYS